LPHASQITMRYELLISYEILNAMILFCIGFKFFKEVDSDEFRVFQEDVYNYISGAQRKKIAFKLLRIESEIAIILSRVVDLRNKAAHWASLDDSIFIANGKNLLVDKSLQISFFKDCLKAEQYLWGKMEEIHKYNIEHKLISQKQYEEAISEMVKLVWPSAPK